MFGEGHKGKVKVLTVQKQLMKDGNSDLEAVSDWSPVSSHKASGDLE